MSNLIEWEDLKKKFIVDETYERERLKNDVERLLRHCRITGQGRVIITSGKLTAKEKIGLVISARFIANKLQKSIPENVTAEEISKYTYIQKPAVSRRTAELVNEAFVFRPEPATYRANAARIDEFLDTLGFSTVLDGASDPVSN